MGARLARCWLCVEPTAATRNRDRGRLRGVEPHHPARVVDRAPRRGARQRSRHVAGRRAARRARADRCFDRLFGRTDGRRRGAIDALPERRCDRTTQVTSRRRRRDRTETAGPRRRGGHAQPLESATIGRLGWLRRRVDRLACAHRGGWAPSALVAARGPLRVRRVRDHHRASRDARRTLRRARRMDCTPTREDPPTRRPRAPTRLLRRATRTTCRSHGAPSKRARRDPRA